MNLLFYALSVIGQIIMSVNNIGIIHDGALIGVGFFAGFAIWEAVTVMGVKGKKGLTCAKEN